MILETQLTGPFWVMQMSSTNQLTQNVIKENHSPGSTLHSERLFVNRVGT